MIRSGLKQFLNSQYPYVSRLNNKSEMDKFILASKILLNDLQAIPVSNCSGRECSNHMLNNCDLKVNYKTPIFQEALIDSQNIVNSNVSKYLFEFNPNTFNPQISRLAQPLDTIGLYHNDLQEPLMDYEKIDGFGPEAKVKLEERFTNPTTPTTHPISDGKNTFYNQYSSIYVNNN
jgi:hypothetical protein